MVKAASQPFLLLISLLSMARAADDQPAFRFAGIPGDHLVLQQDKPLTIWGNASPGAKVTVTLTRDPALEIDPQRDQAPTLLRSKLDELAQKVEAPIWRSTSFSSRSTKTINSSWDQP
jgi:hypothetical protein